MYKLFIVDDEERIRRGLVRCIAWEELGVRLVGEAASGKEALPQVMSLRPDLIITDIRMPDMDGLELVQAVRDLGIPAMVIIISGYSDFEYAQQAIRFGVSDYLLKPIEEPELYERVQACTRRLDAVRQQKSPLKGPEKGKVGGHPAIRKAMAYLEAHYCENVTLQDVAKTVCVHPNYLSALFTKVTGERFNEALNRLRVAKAKELMQQPHFKIYEVAEMVGYSDYRWFSKLFKSMEGVTPAEYRQALEAEQPQETLLMR